MKVLIADKFEASGIEQLKQIADEVVCEPDLKDDALTQRVAGFAPDVLIVRSTKVQAPTIDAGKSLRVIIRAGSGFDTIDVAHAKEKGVKVANCPGMNAIAVAELVMGHIIAVDRRLGDNLADLRAHKWNKKLYSKARGLKGRTLGIVGVGRIGSAVAKRALAFEMKVLFYDVIPDLKPADHPDCRRAEVDEIFRTADFISLHVPGSGDTKHLVNAARLATMRPEAVLINTSRASVIDEPALIEALKAGKIRAAAVDVYDNEPAADAKDITSPMCDVPNLYGTHHIGASTDQAQLAVAEETVRIVAEYRKSGQVLNCVNT
ncbi:MAG: hydroxyacid dehydrogenase [Phycisphaerae bacterium]|jgi:D-3-phosphoglycerate dehydrogenase